MDDIDQLIKNLTSTLETEHFSDRYSKSKSWVVLDSPHSNTGMGFTQREIIRELNSRGIEPALINLLPNGQGIDPKDLRILLRRAKPDYILWIGAIGWQYIEDLMEWEQCQKINLWYDDPVMRMGAMSITHIVKKYAPNTTQLGNIVLKKPDEVQIYIWDSYWRDYLDQLGIRSCLTHLAVNPQDYYTADIQLSDDAVFIGSIHSPSIIEQRINALPPLFKELTRESEQAIFGKDLIPSWDRVIDDVMRSYSTGKQRIIKEIATLQPMLINNVRWLVWALSKNAARQRLLRAAQAVIPITVFTETKQLDHASTEEFKRFIGHQDERIRFVDTSAYRTSQLPHLYHYGAIHLQATDPQTVNEGLPYRMFQTAASGRTLFSDNKPGYSKMFSEKEMLYYNHPNEIEEKLSEAIKDKDKLKEMGLNARKRAESEHTWKHRLDQIC